jgi:uncharacterized membrane protein (DUF2068 family)
LGTPEDGRESVLAIDSAGMARRAPQLRGAAAPSGGAAARIARPEAGVRSIIAYKTVKACVQAALVLVLLCLLPFGLTDWVASAAAAFRHHLVQAWSIRLADAIVRNTGRHRIYLTIAALIFDSVLTGVEARALKRGLWWGPWLVVGASGSLLPFEIMEWIHHPRITRMLLFVFNLLIVAYLARHAWRSHRARSKLTAT